MLSDLAMRSKAHWGYSQEFMKSCEDELTFAPDQIGNDRFDFVVVEKDGKILGFYVLKRLFNAKFEVENFW